MYLHKCIDIETLKEYIKTYTSAIFLQIVTMSISLSEVKLAETLIDPAKRSVITDIKRGLKIRSIQVWEFT